MTKNVLAVCQSCAEHNKGEWKNPRNTASVFLGVCGCCKKIKLCTQSNYWKNLGPDVDMVAPEETPLAEVLVEVKTPPIKEVGPAPKAKGKAPNILG